MNVEELTRAYPLLYHMAEGGSWPSIARHGLLCTAALLDLFEVPHAQRTELLTRKRPESVAITHENHGCATLRDQKPISEAKLRGCLTDDMTVAEWLAMLNSRVFFWVSEERLHTLVAAQAYRERTHDVLIVESAPLIRAYEWQIELAAMNTGNTRPFAHARGPETFKPIATFPYENRRGRGLEPIVELAVTNGIRDIAKYVVSVENWTNGTRIGQVHLRMGSK